MNNALMRRKKCVKILKKEANLESGEMMAYEIKDILIYLKII